MSPLVDLDADVFEYLKSQAEPFTDTPSTVLRRLLQLDDPLESPATAVAAAGPPPRNETAPRAKKRSASRRLNGRTRAASGTLLPEQRYQLPLLRALVDAPGEAAYRDVVEAVGRELNDELLPADFGRRHPAASAGSPAFSLSAFGSSNVGRWIVTPPGYLADHGCGRPRPCRTVQLHLTTDGISDELPSQHRTSACSS